MEYLELILNKIFFVLLEGAILLILFLVITEKPGFLRMHWQKSLFFIISYLSIFNFISSFNFDNFPMILVYITYCILALGYLTKINLYLSIAANIIAFLIYGVTEVAVSMPVIYFMGNSFSAIQNDTILNIKALIIVKSIQIAILVLLTRLYIKPKILENQLFKKASINVSYSLLLVFFVSVFFTYIAKNVNDSAVLFISGFLTLTVILLSILDRKERFELMKIENKFNLQKEYSKHMEQILDTIRKEKHDFKNHISTLVALCTMTEPGTADKIRAYALKLTDSEDISRLHFYNTGNKYLDSLLSVKQNMASGKGIHFEIDVETSLEAIQVDDVDLTSIVGNILDNAFDAVLMNPPGKKKIVSLSIFKEDNGCCISVSNNGSKIPEIHKKYIFDYKYSTKKKTEGERGYGLYIVKELITRNKGKICFQSNEYETEFVLAFQYKGDNDPSLDNKSSLSMNNDSLVEWDNHSYIS